MCGKQGQIILDGLPGQSRIILIYTSLVYYTCRTVYIHAVAFEEPLKGILPHGVGDKP